jgi:hypothetical protein
VCKGERYFAAGKAFEYKQSFTFFLCSSGTVKNAHCLLLLFVYLDVKHQ